MPVPAEWPPTIGLMVIWWGEIELAITMTIHERRMRDGVFDDKNWLFTYKKAEIEFHRRLKEWKELAKQLNNKSPHDLDSLYEELIRMRTIRNNIVHGSYSGCTESAVRYHVSHANRSTRVEAVKQHLKGAPCDQRRAAFQSQEWTKEFINLTHSTVEYEIEAIRQMVSNLPDVLQKIFDVQNSLHKLYKGKL